MQFPASIWISHGIALLEQNLGLLMFSGNDLRLHHWLEKPLETILSMLNILYFSVTSYTEQ